MLKIGLTGGIASGKNFIASLFEKKGWHIIDSDAVSRIVMSPGGLAYKEIVHSFGAEIVLPDGTLDRVGLRAIVSCDPLRRKDLEQIVHPAIAAYSAEIVKEISRKRSDSVVLQHAPLIVETGGHEKLDILILIWCSPEVQKARLKARGYPPYEEALRLAASQLPYEEKLKYAHHVINNNGTEEEAEVEVERVYRLIGSMLQAEKVNRRG